MKNKKIAMGLDLILLILFALMFSYRAISMSFHEIGGLVFFLLSLVHIACNYRFVIAVTKRLFSKALPRKARTCYLIDAAMLVCLLLVGISGIFMSKVVFSVASRTGIWKVLHYFSAALLLILTGVHVGLHAPLIKGVLKRNIRIPAKGARLVKVICLAAVLGAGCYSISASSLSRWILMPFSASQMAEAGERHGGMKAGGMEGKKGKGNGNENGRGEMGKGMQKKDGKGSQSAWFVLGTFLSIIGVFAIATHYAERLLVTIGNKRNQKLLESKE